MLVLSFFLSSCSVVQKTSKQELSDGVYLKTTENEKQKVYINVVDDSIRIYQTITLNHKIHIDTLKPLELYLSKYKTSENSKFSLSNESFDIDFLTMPVKFRFATKGVPVQLNSELNASVFFGYRNDRYSIKYITNPLNISKLRITHFGYSVGLFNSIGNTFMSPTNTNDKLQQEYDGIVWSKGLAGIIGVNNLSLGLAIGFDNLLDQNSSSWIYENKPWIGLGFGLNLN